MIIGNLQNSSRIESLHPMFSTLFDYVKAHDFLQLPLGRVSISADDLFILNVELEGADENIQPLEMHRWVDLLPGQFAIVYPEDPHAPAVGTGKIRKLIAKVAL